MCHEPHVPCLVKTLQLAQILQAKHPCTFVLFRRFLGMFIWFIYTHFSQQEVVCQPSEDLWLARQHSQLQHFVAASKGLSVDPFCKAMKENPSDISALCGILLVKQPNN